MKFVAYGTEAVITMTTNERNGNRKRTSIIYQSRKCIFFYTHNYHSMR
jgi:hypothetical protein